MRHARAAGLLLLLLLAGCGEDEAVAPAATPAAKQQIAQTIHSYLDAYIHGRGAEACEQFTERLRRADDAKAKGGGFPGGCAQVMSEVGPELVKRVPAAQRRDFVDVMVNSRVDARLADDLALATVTLRDSDYSSPKRIELRREGGRWLINRLAIAYGTPWP